MDHWSTGPLTTAALLTADLTNRGGRIRSSHLHNLFAKGQGLVLVRDRNAVDRGLARLHAFGPAHRLRVGHHHVERDARIIMNAIIGLALFGDTELPQER